MRTVKRSLIAVVAALLFAACGMEVPEMEAPDPVPAPDPGGFSTVPGAKWQRYTDAREAGFDNERLSEARAFSNEIGSDAVLVVHRGVVVADWGQTERRFWCHSSRKSLVSLLAGIYEARGHFDLESTMMELGIDDDPALTDMERTARVIDILEVRSGIYLASAADPTPPLLERGSRAPGETWFYNNWDFNIMGVILEQQTGTPFFEGFHQELASPLQMEHFELFHGHYFFDPGPDRSIHPAQLFRMSSRDMARIGLLVLNEGAWGDSQIVPSAWIQDMTSPRSETREWYEALREHYPPEATQTATLYEGAQYGYMWWIFDSPRTYAAAGNGMQTINVLPEHDLVIVHRSNTFAGEKVTLDAHHELLGRIAAARIGPPALDPELVALEDSPLPYEPIDLPATSLERFSGGYELGGDVLTVTVAGSELRITHSALGTFSMQPTAELEFFVEDMNAPATFTESPGGLIGGVLFGHSGNHYTAVP